jgi:hypothetical protein
MRLEPVDTNGGKKDSIGENLLGARVGWVNLRISVLGWRFISYSHNGLLETRLQKCLHCRSSSALCLTWKARDTRVHLPAPLLRSTHRGVHPCRPSHGVISPFFRRGIPTAVFCFLECYQSPRVTETLVLDICHQPMILERRCSLPIVLEGLL